MNEVQQGEQKPKKTLRRKIIGWIFTVVVGAIAVATGTQLDGLAEKFADETEAQIVLEQMEFKGEGLVANPDAGVLDVDAGQ